MFFQVPKHASWQRWCCRLFKPFRKDWAYPNPEFMDCGQFFQFTMHLAATDVTCAWKAGQDSVFKTPIFEVFVIFKAGNFCPDIFPSGLMKKSVSSFKDGREMSDRKQFIFNSTFGSDR